MFTIRINFVLIGDHRFGWINYLLYTAYQRRVCGNCFFFHFVFCYFQMVQAYRIARQFLNCNRQSFN